MPTHVPALAAPAEAPTSAEDGVQASMPCTAITSPLAAEQVGDGIPVVAAVAATAANGACRIFFAKYRFGRRDGFGGTGKSLQAAGQEAAGAASKVSEESSCKAGGGEFCGEASELPEPWPCSPDFLDRLLRESRFLSAT
ncbi:hypothetical protein VOLCADRAFT_87506 [Volvox carteri f. nagariensis]|uniref:Uncharacterized protein n=1 Tax=Volvox carteri f. nagariensis TaxID=3068 RepID=D8TLH3_VOLCA|nr:uncharacterized protein VOLCADRAFT_87506 [Volvox carteri f. nagariensis]EFJ51735.1 hypothetical protein VOLCADRAFT_87506 [Volvox carteri f. nagariensis]|eukprot:XP_002947145.1 hypothetical protein VOLCADRAFT_87506 [Volvox carteri f. nagariensis]